MMSLSTSLNPWATPESVRLPAAWEPHQATVLGFPCGDDLWFGELSAVRHEHAQLVLTIAGGEDVVVLVPPEAREAACAAAWYGHPRVRVVSLELDDIWLRDSGPVVVECRGPGALGRSAVSKLAYNFIFNAWGEKFAYGRDRLVARRVSDALGVDSQSIPLVFEGGSLDSNGCGAALTTRQCLLEKRRNPAWSEAELDSAVKNLFGLSELVWLGDGMAGDHTDGHVDTIVRFVSPDTVVCHYAESQSHPSYDALHRNFVQLQKLATSGTSAVRHVVPLPLPRKVETFEGDYKTMSYANFYCCNAGLIVPQFGDANDDLVIEILKGLVTDRPVIGLEARHIVLGGGVFNCLTQQIPGAPAGTGAAAISER